MQSIAHKIAKKRLQEAIRGRNGKRNLTTINNP